MLVGFLVFFPQDGGVIWTFFEHTEPLIFIVFLNINSHWLVQNVYRALWDGFDFSFPKTIVESFINVDKLPNYYEYSMPV